MPDTASPQGASEPVAAAELRVNLTSIALGPDYPPAVISAEIGRVAVAAARVDQEYALLLSTLHGGRRNDWDLEELQKRSSSDLKKLALRRINDFFEGELLVAARRIVTDAYAALEHRHAVMHTIWTLTGPDAMTEVAEFVAALNSSDPNSSLADLVGRDVASDGWRTLHPRVGGPGPASVAELGGIRHALEVAQTDLEELRFTLASALYVGKPPGARRVLDPHASDHILPGSDGV